MFYFTTHYIVSTKYISHEIGLASAVAEFNEKQLLLKHRYNIL